MNTINLPQGTYSGASANGVSSFHNIPFTGPYRRFESPTPLSPSSAVSDARHFGAICPQNPSRLEIVMGPMPPGTGPHDEVNCGVLSVYRPEASHSERLPVIVWLHGGAFISGGSQIPIYDGSRLARDGQVIVVCLNYRLGVFGFLYDETRSLSGPNLPVGTEDCIAGFEWVHQNIDKFGGDAGNITAMGQSAGGFHVQCLLDHRPDLFRRAIIQSAPGNLLLNAEQASSVRKSVADNLPAGSTLASASTADMLAAQGAALRAHSGMLAPFTPTTTDGVAPGFRSGRADRPPKDILCGWTDDDASAFACLGLMAAGVPAWMQQTMARSVAPAMTRKVFSDGAVQLAEHLRQKGDKVTTFVLDWKPRGFDLGAAHCCDLPLLFGDEEAWKESPMLGDEPWSEWERRGKILRLAWAQFAREGSLPTTVEGVRFE